MDKTGWRTHCFGRFLVDLPPQAKISQTYKLWGDEIKRLYETSDSLTAKINKREQELKAQKHGTEGSMFVRHIDHGNGSITLLSWDSGLPDDKEFMWIDSYLVSNKNWRTFQYSGGLSASKQQSALGLSDNLAKNLQFRGPTEIPIGPGYCIDGGFIAGNEYRAESFTIDVKLPNHPGAMIEIFAGTQGEPEQPLLERMGGFLQTVVAGPIAGVKTLRKGNRDVGPIQAEEYLIAATDKGQRAYTFAWESAGKANSIAQPNLGVGLGVLGQSVVDEDNPYQPAFESDEEALELWDAIIESVRLRPGAA